MKNYSKTLVILTCFLPFVAGAYDFRADLKVGVRGEAVRELQKVLNTNPQTQVSQSGAGSSGNETDYFGPATARAVIKFQELYASEVLAPARLTSGTGFVGSATRKKLNTLSLSAVTTVKPVASAPTLPAPVSNPPSTPSQTNVSPTPSVTSPPAVATVPAKPAMYITSVSPSRVYPGDRVTVYGSGFPLTGNSVILSYGAVEERFSDLSSPDGKTISFYFNPRAVNITKEMLANLPPQAITELQEPLRKEGMTLSDLADPYRTLSNLNDLEAILRKYGNSLDDFYDNFFVTVQNGNAKTTSYKAILLGFRKINFGGGTFSHLKSMLLPLAKSFMMVPETAHAQFGAGVTSGFLFNCTCGPGHIAFLANESGSSGLFWFPPGFVPMAGSTVAPGFWLGYYAQNAGQCWMNSGPSCFNLSSSMPVGEWGQGSFSPVGP